MPSPLKGLLISDFTTDVLGSLLQNSTGFPPCSIKIIAWGEFNQALADEKNPLWKEKYDFLLFWCQPWALMPSFAKLMGFRLDDPSSIKDELNRFIEILKKKASTYRFCLVVSFLLPYYYRGLGPIDYKENGVHYWLHEINHILMKELSFLPNAFMLDPNRWINAVGPNATNPKLWYMSKIPYDIAVFKTAASEIKNTLLSLSGETKKIILLDLDNTLWGGEVGEIGWENIQLGGHDAIGESFADFQRQLKNLKNRGILLAIISKNEASTALEAIQKHPEMILKQDDFVGWRINWQDKAQNITDLLFELNLTSHAAVFIDDHPGERDRVKKALPEITVADWPDQSFLYSKALLSLPYFDTVHFENEDRQRTSMYLGEKKRQELKEQTASLDSWLKSLHVSVTMEELNKVNLPRATQLLNKTNQMNLTTRRLSETELYDWSRQKDNKVWTIRVSDDIDDSGLTGLMSIEKRTDHVQIIDFVLSCRVFGRMIEKAMLAKIILFAKDQADLLIAEYLPTPKNQPCLTFWQRSGLKQRQDGYTFSWDLKNPYPYPETLIIKDLGRE